jgi:hypothetical protein
VKDSRTIEKEQAVEKVRLQKMRDHEELKAGAQVMGTTSPGCYKSWRELLRVEDLRILTPKGWEL